MSPGDQSEEVVIVLINNYSKKKFLKALNREQSNKDLFSNIVIFGYRGQEILKSYQGNSICEIVIQQKRIFSILHATFYYLDLEIAVNGKFGLLNFALNVLRFITLRVSAALFKLRLSHEIKLPKENSRKYIISAGLEPYFDKKKIYQVYDHGINPKFLLKKDNFYINKIKYFDCLTRDEIALKKIVFIPFYKSISSLIGSIYRLYKNLDFNPPGRIIIHLHPECIQRQKDIISRIKQIINFQFPGILDRFKLQDPMLENFEDIRESLYKDHLILSDYFSTILFDEKVYEKYILDRPGLRMGADNFYETNYCQEFNKFYLEENYDAFYASEVEEDE